MPLTTTNTTVRGGSCGFYGAPASSTARSCFDCLTYVVASEPQGCMVNEAGLCASMVSYDPALDFRRLKDGSTTSSTSSFQFPAANATYCDTSMMTNWCTKCLASSSYDGFCNFGTCLCIGKCELEPPATTAPPAECGEEEFCTLSRKILAGAIVGLGIMAYLCCYCCRCWMAVSARRFANQNEQQQLITIQQLEQLRDVLLRAPPMNSTTTRSVVRDDEGCTTVSGVKYYVLPEPPIQAPQHYSYDVENDDPYPYVVDGPH